VLDAKAPILKAVNVVVVLAISVSGINDALGELSHFVTLPVLPLNVRSAGKLWPLQIVWLALTAPAEGTLVTVTCTVLVTVQGVAKPILSNAKSFPTSALARSNNCKVTDVLAPEFHAYLY